MYTEYSKKKKNRKALLLLLVLGVFGFVAFKYTKVKDIVAKGNNSEASTCVTPITDKSYDDTSKYFIIDDAGEISDITPVKSSTEGTVLGTASNGCTTRTLATSDSGSLESKSDFSINGKSFLASEVTITMSEIKAPFVLFSGSNKLQIKDSNRNNSGVYKPAGEQYDKRQVLVNTTPGADNDEMEGTLDSAPVKVNFGTKYAIATAEAEDSVSIGNIVVNKYIDSDCVECNNISNPNPKKSNEVSRKFTDINFVPPSSSSEESEPETSLEILNPDENYRDLSLLSLINPTVCSDPYQNFLGTIASFFPSHDWNQCDPEEDVGCVSASSLVVKMSPMFKETNTYMGLRNSSAMDPMASSSYTPVYVLTSCKAIITNTNTHAFMKVDVKCVWDMSYLFYENAASAYDEKPGSTIMTDEEYIEYLKRETVTRESESFTSM